MVIVEYEDNNIGEVIRERRLDLQMTQKELARKANISPASLRLYEEGHQTPTINMLRNIMKNLDVNEVRLWIS